MQLLQYLAENLPAAIAVAGILGLLVGSFLNVVIYRLPVMMEREWTSQCKALLETDDADSEQSSFNLVTPNSHCPKCDTPIKAWQNIPVISYLMLGGKCNNCKTAISKRYPFVEFVTGLLSCLVIWHFGINWQGGLMLLLTWALITLTMIDFDHQLLPDSITLPLLWIGLIANSFGLFCSLPEALWGAVFGYLSLWSVYWLFKLLTGKEGMGYGDFKLLAVLGAWFGWQLLPMIILLSSLVGAIVGIFLLVLKNRGKSVPIPFGPYLAAAGFITAIWGEQITRLYLDYSGL
ncbi:Leader peptidase (Prepilin peptidase) / N-methyltransferase [gamma proteobacterium IMCC2047]|nr:Leader peptidase (Prepilin peptidase) / N-methyltransferase [gamma proteobacterium IMCC2047]